MRRIPKDGYLAGFIKGIINVFSGGTAVLDEQLRSAHRSDVRRHAQTGATATVELDPSALRKIRITYSPEGDGAPDAGEIVWTWVPYAEGNGEGKDRPVLVIGRQEETRVYAVKLTSKSHDGDHEYLSIGSGPWDSQRRESWVDLDQVYSVHDEGMRREAGSLDRKRFARVAAVLHERYGWPVGRI